MSTKKFNHREAEPKWQEKWKSSGVYSVDLNAVAKPFYNLMMFPYPSAEGLHVGNMYAFTGADVYGRFQRMQGFDVFEPIGLDGFGIHSENYAIKVCRHPKEHAQISEAHFYKQLTQIGNGFAWDNHVETYDPEYYKWTQWLFIQMFNRGLAYKGTASVNWCPSCKTVLADEQVEDGRCERCKTVVERRDMSSWYFKITEYADRLLKNIDTINWPEKIKTAQRQWIGKSEGMSIGFEVEGITTPIEVWTKFWETIFGVTFLVLAPEHPIVGSLPVPEENRAQLDYYVRESLQKTEQQRLSEAGDKTGVFTGVYARNPVNGAHIPIWVADYVLKDVGTGAVMGVPAHDKRDYDFAKKYHLDIVQVVESEAVEIRDKNKVGELVFEGDGLLVNSQQFNGLSAWGEGKAKIAEWMSKEGFARSFTTYHLRDWIISRQRYWGPPIPMINCSKCGWQPVPESDLPVLLPDIDDYKPHGDGTSPLANASEEWRITTCPKCGGKAERELNVSDTFLDSSWYYLAYLHMNENKWETGNPFNKDRVNKWLPVNAYIGGAEHAVLHLLYARFVAMVLHDMNLVPFEEPFSFLFSHGLIIKDGAKMSKSRGNVVVPDEYIEKYGADTLRMYLMFLGPYDLGGDFRDTGIEGMNRFIRKLWDLFHSAEPEGWDDAQKASIYVKLNKTIKKVTEDMSGFRYNTAISSVMELVNTIKEQRIRAERVSDASHEWKDILGKIDQLIAPFAPHIAEEVWVNVLGREFSIHASAWPTFKAELLIEDTVNMIIQVQGKLRGIVPMNINEAQDEKAVDLAARRVSDINRWLEAKKIKNTIFVPGKILNYLLED